MQLHRIFALGGALLLSTPFAVIAQPAAKLPIIGVLLPNKLDRDFPAFFSKLRELSYEDARTVSIVIKHADTKLERLPTLAAELVQMKPAVIVTSNTPPTRAATNATRHIPIVMSLVGDPVESGFVSNLSRPGGNVTGRANLVADLAAKRLQLLKDIVPRTQRIAMLFTPDDSVTTPQIREIERSIAQVDVSIRFIPVHKLDGPAAAFEGVISWRADAVQWVAGQEHAFISPSIAMAAEWRLPLMVPRRQQVEAGGLADRDSPVDQLEDRAGPGPEIATDGPCPRRRHLRVDRAFLPPPGRLPFGKRKA